jgi:hypothetical protein
MMLSKALILFTSTVGLFLPNAAQAQFSGGIVLSSANHGGFDGKMHSNSVLTVYGPKGYHTFHGPLNLGQQVTWTDADVATPLGAIVKKDSNPCGHPSGPRDYTLGNLMPSGVNPSTGFPHSLRLQGHVDLTPGDGPDSTEDGVMIDAYYFDGYPYQFFKVVNQGDTCGVHVGDGAWSCLALKNEVTYKILGHSLLPNTNARVLQLAQWDGEVQYNISCWIKTRKMTVDIDSCNMEWNSASPVCEALGTSYGCEGQCDYYRYVRRLNEGDDEGENAEGNGIDEIEFLGEEEGGRKLRLRGSA